MVEVKQHGLRYPERQCQLHQEEPEQGNVGRSADNAEECRGHGRINQTSRISALFGPELEVQRHCWKHALALYAAAAGVAPASASAKTKTDRLHSQAARISGEDRINRTGLP